MELIIQSYGKFLLGAVVFVTFWMLALGNISGQNGHGELLQICGMDVSGIQHVYGADFEQCILEAERCEPQILCRYTGALSVGSYCVDDLFEAVDCNGEELLVEVRELWITDGVNKVQEIYVGEDIICFQENGMYQVQLYAVDQWNGEVVCDVYIPVN